MITGALILLITIIVVALVFEYINGFHDCANVVATIVSTKVLTPKQAIIMAAIFNFIGALLGTGVAKTIGQGLVDTNSVDQITILCALIGAIVWNLITWYYGIPSSSSHALVGGLLGAVIVKAQTLSVVKMDGVLNKVIYPMFSSPLIAFVVGFLMMLALLWMVYKARPDILNKYFRNLQILSSAIMALSHGTNDAQKTMGIIALALISFTASQGAVSSEFHIPMWVIIICAVTMGLGTMAGGYKIIRTMGSKVIKMRPIHGFATEMAASTVILTASHFGLPISTTHVKSCAIIGVGSIQNPNAVKWGLVGNIVTAWFVTIPVCMLISALSYYIIHFFI